MPISGFKTGDCVFTPGGHAALVISTRRKQGRERVLIEYMNGMLGRKEFDAATLKLQRGGRA
jgi:hypothetical protein